MSNLILFQNQELGKIRILDQKGEPWFIAKDVCKILGYKNPRKAVADHVDVEDKNTVTIRYGNKGNPNQVIINESGLYSLILRSNKPEAKKFKRWVTSEVLPAIRKTGRYELKQIEEKIEGKYRLSIRGYKGMIGMKNKHIKRLQGNIANLEKTIAKKDNLIEDLRRDMYIVLGYNHLLQDRNDYLEKQLQELKAKVEKFEKNKIAEYNAICRLLDVGLSIKRNLAQFEKVISALETIGANAEQLKQFKKSLEYFMKNFEEYKEKLSGWGRGEKDNALMQNVIKILK